MAHIITLPEDPHLATQALLPWYANDTLEADERAQVEAHLAGCPDCQAELAFDQRLKSEIAALPEDAAAPGWERLRGRLDGRVAAPRRPWFAAFGAGRAARPWLGLALAAQAGVFLILGLALAPLMQPRYHALGAAPAHTVGNLVVIFRPETRERDLRALLAANRLRLVDGPTASDAYVLSAPAADRAAILARLRASPAVVLAEPVEPGAPG